MEKEVKTTMWIQDDAVRLEAYFEDFKGSVDDWKIAFYEVWRYQMYYTFAYSITVEEKNDSSVYMSLLVKKAYLKNAKMLLKDIGCRNVQEQEEHIGLVQLYYVDDDKLHEVIAD